jgi:hypothetical protein
MSPETEELLRQVTKTLKASVRAGDCPAVVGVADPNRTLTLTDYDYQRDDNAATTFERRAAAKAVQISAVRWVIAVPQVWVIAPDVISVRAVSNLPLRPGESEAITWMAFDLTSGVDYGRVPITRQPHGEPMFGDIEVVVAQASPSPAMPGYTLLQQFTAAIQDDSAL